MKILRYNLTDFSPDEAHDLCALLEEKLGVNLMNHDANNPNVVHGFFNTSTDADGNAIVEIQLYEQSDLDMIAAVSSPSAKVPLEVHDQDDADIISAADAHLVTELEGERHEDHPDEGFIVQPINT